MDNSSQIVPTTSENLKYPTQEQTPHNSGSRSTASGRSVSSLYSSQTYCNQQKKELTRYGRQHDSRTVDQAAGTASQINLSQRDRAANTEDLCNAANKLTPYFQPEHRLQLLNALAKNLDVSHTRFYETAVNNDKQQVNEALYQILHHYTKMKGSEATCNHLNQGIEKTTNQLNAILHRINTNAPPSYDGSDDQLNQIQYPDSPLTEANKQQKTNVKHIYYARESLIIFAYSPLGLYTPLKHSLASHLKCVLPNVERVFDDQSSRSLPMTEQFYQLFHELFIKRMPVDDTIENLVTIVENIKLDMNKKRQEFQDIQHDRSNELSYPLSNLRLDMPPPAYELSASMGSDFPNPQHQATGDEIKAIWESLLEECNIESDELNRKILKSKDHKLSAFVDAFSSACDIDRQAVQNEILTSTGNPFYPLLQTSRQEPEKILTVLRNFNRNLEEDLYSAAQQTPARYLETDL
ncbi:hypothetical protein [uncultured Endozoicomonas sp.]|uniref:hypothetical protein n=1 Tax=uncultured Endozoicomonas sp. TaxID=432652 RepID=UPI002605976D|nr:hypothetical protein [uncultured Endozoicomonas sp.]